ncbi:unnamed protein product [Toxocara canis]|uniref:Uncharacterized protein n=1 Tax=Toxocara canis TaxID=6265 RepID=A0A183UA51_TOXCA|nr:unnamed protein product [Toxocara canis]
MSLDGGAWLNWLHAKERSSTAARVSSRLITHHAVVPVYGRAFASEHREPADTSRTSTIRQYFLYFFTWITRNREVVKLEQNVLTLLRFSILGCSDPYYQLAIASMELRNIYSIYSARPSINEPGETESGLFEECEGDRRITCKNGFRLILNLSPLSIATTLCLPTEDCDARARSHSLPIGGGIGAPQREMRSTAITVLW